MVEKVALSTLLPYQDLFHEGTMRLTGNGLMAMIEYRGVDHELVPNAGLLNLSNRVGSYFSAFATQSGWTINVDLTLTEAGPYLSGPRHLGGKEFSSEATGAARFIDDVRARRFAGQLSDERAFVAVTMRVPKAKAAFLEKAIKKGGEARRDAWLPYVEDFSQAVDALLNALDTEFRDQGFARRMDANAVLRFLAFAISGVPAEHLKFPSGVASWPFSRLVEDDLLLGRQVRIDGRPVRHVRTIGLAGAPAFHTPEMMAGLLTIGHPLRVSQRFKLSPSQAVHDHYRKGMKFSRDEERGILGHAMNLLPGTRALTGPDPINMAKTILATQEASDTARIECGGTLTTSVLVYSDSWQDADARAKAVRTFIENKIGFKAKIENANSQMAYIASFPGEVMKNRRGDVLPNDFLSRRMRVVAPWTGPMESAGPWGGAPLVQAVTERNAKFFFDPFGAKWGHIVGAAPNGSGKSTTSDFLAMQWRARHPTGKIIKIQADSNLSTSVVATLADGGRIISLDDKSVGLQPLRNLDDGDVLKNKHGWVQSLCHRQNVPPTPELNDDILGSLKLLATERHDRRTMNQLYRLAETPALRKALSIFVNDGPYARLLNGTTNPFAGTNNILLELGKFASHESPLDEPIIEAAMYEVENAIDDVTPTFMIIDEGKITVRAMGEDRAVDYAARMRKKMCILMFLFHFVDRDFVNLVAALREQCSWRLFFPNENAGDPGARQWMEPLGITDTMARRIANAPKGCIAGVHGNRARMFDLALGGEELALCGINGKLRNEKAIQLYNRVGPERFWIEWLIGEGVNVDEKNYLPVAHDRTRLAIAG